MLLAILLLVAQTSQPPSPRRGDEAQQHIYAAQQESRTPDRHESVTTSAPDRSADQASTPSSSATQEDGKAPNNGWTSPQVITAAIYDVLTLLVLVFVGLQWKASQTAAEAAGKSADVADRALRLTARGRLAVGRWRITQPPRPSQFACTFRIKNYGGTVAKLLEVRQGATICEPDLLHRERALADEPTLDAPIWIEPRDKITLMIKLPIDAADATNIANRTVLLVAWGRLVYEDVFGDICTLGYAAVFDQTSDELVYLPDAQYNYERRDQRPEGERQPQR